MSDVLHTAAENLPYLATAAGAAIGVAGEAVMHRSIQEQRTPLVEEYGNLFEQEELSRKEKFGRYVVGPLALTGAVVGLANGLAWQHEAPDEHDIPRVQLVVDYSGATGVGEPGSRPVDTTNKVVDIFADRNDDDFSVQAYVAHAGGVTSREPDTVDNLTPFGRAPLDQALTHALDSVTTEVIPSDDDEKNAAIVVVTNGNSIGGVNSVVSRADKQGANASVYVVNVKDTITEKQQADLEAIATKTGGQYWTEQEATTENISSIIEDLEPPKQELEPSHGVAERILAGLVSAGLLVTAVRARRNQPLTAKGLRVPKEGKGE